MTTMTTTTTLSLLASVWLGFVVPTGQARLHASCYPYRCLEAPACGEGYACHDLQSPEKPWCPIHAHCVPTCDVWHCSEGYKCQLVDQFPRCVVDDNGGDDNGGNNGGSSSCSYGEAWNHKTGQCLPFSCHSEKACPDPDKEFCIPKRPPNFLACQHQYWATGEPCMHYECLAHDPCPANFCDALEGTVCQIHPNKGHPACFCDEPFYTYNATTKSCDPVSCQAPTACQVGKEVCVPTFHPADGDPLFSCAKTCPTGTKLDDLDNTCKAVSCEAGKAACPDIFGLECIDKPEITCIRAPCAQFACEFADDYDPCVLALCPQGTICEARDSTADDCPPFQTYCPPKVAECVAAVEHCDDGYALDVHENCVPITCVAPNACPTPAVCVDIAEPDCSDITDHPCRAYDCEWPEDYDSCTATTCEIGTECQVAMATEEDCPPFVDFCPPTIAICVPKCPTGKEYDAALSKCIAVSCDATDACHPSETCVPFDSMVHCDEEDGKPCPQFTCKATVCLHVQCPANSYCIPHYHNAAHPMCVCPHGLHWNPHAHYCL